MAVGQLDLLTWLRHVTICLNRSPILQSNQSLISSLFQILPTVSSSLHQQPGGIQVELDEVEARNEDFPMTLAFLELMNMLTDNPIPAGLGAGYRVPGFQPYLDFLRDSVFLKFNTRAYKKPEQKVNFYLSSNFMTVLKKTEDYTIKLYKKQYYMLIFVSL